MDLQTSVSKSDADAAGTNESEQTESQCKSVKKNDNFVQNPQLLATMCTRVLEEHCKGAGNKSQKVHTAEAAAANPAITLSPSPKSSPTHVTSPQNHVDICVAKFEESASFVGPGTTP